MNIQSVNSTSFGAKLLRQTKVARDKATGEKYNKECTKSQLIKSYDSQIEKIKEQKKRAMELDTFMRSDEVMKLVKKLPKNAEVEVASKFELNFDSSNEDIILENARIIYENDNPESCCLEAIDAQMQDGSIDKKGIIKWLKYLNAREKSN